MSPNTDTIFNSEIFAKNFKSNPFSASNGLAESNQEDLKEVELPENVHLPTGDDIIKMKQWEDKYRTENPKASDREVRRAVHRQFNVIIIEERQAMLK